MKKNNVKGFTLVELLAVIVILGLLMAIAIPSVTKYITQSRVKTLTSTMDSYVTAVITQVNNGEYKFSDSTKIFAIPIECIELEKGGTNPFGNWHQANEAYWAYVLVHYDSANYNYEYGFTFKDDAGYGLYPTKMDKITNDLVRTGYDDLTQPKNGKAVDFVPLNKWEGFSNITALTGLVVLQSESEGVEGNGKTTCTLCQKGDNYDQVEQSKQDNTNELPNVATPIYFGYKYNALNLEPNGEYVVWGYVFHENGSADVYVNEVYWTSLPAGSMTYKDNKIYQNGSVTHNISSDKRTLTATDGSGELWVHNPETDEVYFGRNYVGYMDGEKYTYVMYEDCSGFLYVNGIVAREFPSGYCQFTNVAILMEGKVRFSLSKDKRTAVVLDEPYTGIKGTWVLEE